MPRFNVSGNYLSFIYINICIALTSIEDAIFDMELYCLYEAQNYVL